MKTTEIPLPGTNGHLVAYSDEYVAERGRSPPILICPGGAYLRLSDREAGPIAARFASHGYRPFVLRYSIGVQFPVPMLELAAAVSLVRQQAERWSVDPSFLTVCGFSAGGHLASYYAVSRERAAWAEALGVSKDVLAPSAVVLGYPVIDLASLRRGMVKVGEKLVDLPQAMLDQVLGPDAPADRATAYRSDLLVTGTSPPMFIWHTAEDPLVPVLNSSNLAAALSRAGVAHELHIYDGDVHGLALADATTDEGGRFLNPAASAWPELAIDFLHRMRSEQSIRQPFAKTPHSD